MILLHVDHFGKRRKKKELFELHFDVYGGLNLRVVRNKNYLSLFLAQCVSRGFDVDREC
jgi:hypothetical protein